MQTLKLQFTRRHFGFALWVFVFNIDLFGYIGLHVGSFVEAHGLPGCGVWTPWLWCVDSGCGVWTPCLWCVDSLVAVCGLPGCGVWTLWLWCVDSLAVALRVQLVCSVIVVHGLSCSQACGILVSWPGMDRTCVPCMTTWILHNWTTREVPPSKLLRLFSKSLV